MRARSLTVAALKAVGFIVKAPGVAIRFGAATVRERAAGLLTVFALATASCHATTYFLTVAGLGGEPEYEQRFSGWAKDIDKSLKGAPDSIAVTLYGTDATHAKIQSTLRDFATRAKKDDALVVMLMGHGSFDGLDYKFEIPGSDLSAIELASLLDHVPAGRQLVVNMTSASGGSLSALVRPNRVIICATKSGTEKNATVFARYWVEALRDPAADADKNDTITALEAFRYAEKKTSGFYQTQKRLATEHAVLEDTGHGEPVRDPNPENGQGLIANRFVLLRIGATSQAVARDPEKLKLLGRKEEIEQAIDKLKYEKAAMRSDEYKSKLSTLLVQLAEIQEELDK